MLKCVALCVTLAGCFIFPPDDPPVPIDPAQRVEIMTVTPNLDLLFVIDDSPTMADKQGHFNRAFPALLAQLENLPAGLPNLHIGVISTDMGSKGSDDAAPGPGIGAVGQGGCASTGKAGGLLINGAPIIPDGNGDQEPFLATDRLGNANFTGPLADAFATMSTLGAGGCGFEQQFHATRAALAANPANTGFLRSSANLGIVMLTDEDDCSMKHSTLMGPESGALGPQQSFRCFRFGVTCAQDSNAVGAKSDCRSNESSDFVESVGEFSTFLAGLKSHPNRVMFGAVIGAPTPVAVEVRTLNGSSQNAVAHTCNLPDPSTGFNLVADPGVRLQELAETFPGASHVESICSTDLTSSAQNLGAQLAQLVDATCLPTALSPAADCVVEDRSDFQATVDTLLPCTGSEAPGTSCFRILDDASCSSGQRLDFTRPVPEVSDRASTLKCAQ